MRGRAAPSRCAARREDAPHARRPVPPLFVEGSGVREPVASMPGVFRLRRSHRRGGYRSPISASRR
jgi:hypothetical protein